MSSNSYIPRYQRKQNYESLNYQTPQAFSPSHSRTQQDLSAHKKSIQHQQIEDLQQKCELILAHNQTILAQNAELKRKLSEADALGAASLKMQKMSRYQVQDQQYAIRKVRSQLQIKTRECEVLVCELQAMREATGKQIASLRGMIGSLTASNEESKQECAKLNQELQRVREEDESDRRIAVKEAERRGREEISKIQKNASGELAKEKVYYTNLIEEMKNKFEQQRSEWQTRQNSLVNKLQDNHNKQINELRDQMMGQFNYELRKLEEEATERCKNERDKAEEFIRQSMAGLEMAAEAENEVLRQQIRSLQVSLESRKKLIEELTTNELSSEMTVSGLNELLQIRVRLKEQVQHMMRQNELLKVKTAEKYEKDLGEMVRIYEDKIEILSIQIRNLIEQNDRIRKMYEEEVEKKISQKRAGEIEINQLKNLVRKLKVEIQGVQEEFRLNIDGMRDQNVTLSMTMMKSMMEVKDKASFFEDQNRKLRALYNKHEAEVELEKKQAEEKVSYFQGKVAHLQKLIEEEKRDVAEREELLSKSFEQKENMLRKNLEKERELIEALLNETEKENEELKGELKEAHQNYRNLQLDLREAKEENNHLMSRIKDYDEHIEKLRMELEMAGSQDREKDEALDNWKRHYEDIILGLEGDKRSLKEMMEGQGEKLERMIYKYRIMEEELKKAGEAMKKKGELDRRVLELGMDENLVKNTAELWHRQN